jgi:hypothetical protein
MFWLPFLLLVDFSVVYPLLDAGETAIIDISLTSFGTVV